MMFFASFGPDSGPLLSGAGYYAIAVLPYRTARAPIGMALADGEDQNGLALWRLTIGEVDMPGLHVVIDRKFRPAGWSLADRNNRGHHEGNVVSRPRRRSDGQAAGGGVGRPGPPA
jgi:hypothetical protein